VKAKLDLSMRLYRCEVCGLKLDRDLNAARNLAHYAEQVLGGIDPMVEVRAALESRSEDAGSTAPSSTVAGSDPETLNARRGEKVQDPGESPDVRWSPMKREDDLVPALCLGEPDGCEDITSSRLELVGQA
jgi:hypothetical protein